MGIVGIITAIAGLLWAINALQRSGFDIRALNPFAWMRRREWEKRYGEKPLYTLADPVDVAGVLLLGVARCDGELSSGQKARIIECFEQEMKLSRDQAADLLRASAHLIRNEVYIVDQLDRILEPAADRFTPMQVASVLNLMTRVAASDSPVNAEQQKLIDGVQSFFNRRASGNQRAWG